MFIVPEARTAILRVVVVATVSVLCIIAATRARSRWARILFGTIAVLGTLYTASGLFVVYLIMRYGPR